MMDVTKLLRLYVEANILLAIGFCVIAIIFWVNTRRLSLHGQSLLRVSYLIVTAALMLPPLLLAFPGQSYFKPAAQVWSAQATKLTDASQLPAVGFQVFSARPFDVSQETQSLGIALAILCFCIAGFRVSKYFLALVRLNKTCLAQPVVRQSGRVRVIVSNDATVPFSTNLFTHAFVVVPNSYLSEPLAFKIAICHELQHHRQRDTTWLHLLEVLKAIFFLNPFAHSLCRRISEVQEFACDEALVGHQKFSFTQYGRCLLWAAQSASKSSPHLVGTASMATTFAGEALRRRIEMLAQNKGGKSSRIASVLACGFAAVSLCGGAVAAKDSLKDRRISLEHAESLAAVARENSDFPIVVDELVLEQLNGYVGTPDGRVRMRKALARMQDFREMVSTKLTSSRLPSELAAIPIVESGYENLPQNVNSPHGGGMWQFIPSTARRYGLQVDSKRDDRRIPAKSTDAAIAYLTKLHSQFQDWGLAIAAYNMGEGRVQAAIDETGIRDPWELARREKLEKYLSAVMAAVIIIKNPALIE